MLRRLPPALVAAALAAAATLAGSTAAGAAPVPDRTFTAAADAYVQEATPAVAEGNTDPQNCKVDDDPGTRRTCLVQFTVTGLGAGDTVTGARVLLNVKGNSTPPKPLIMSTVVQSWSELGVTWNGRPAVGAQVASTSTLAFKTDAVFELAAGTVTGNGSYSFAVSAAPGTLAVGTNFYSKENTDGQPGPRLVLAVDHVDPPRFPGDPGAGNFLTGLNNEGTFGAVEAQMPHPFGLRRSYNGNNWGVPKTAVAADIAAGRVPLVSWKFAPWTVSTVPQSAIDTVCADLASYAPHPIIAAIYHEPTGDIVGTADRAAYRALQRQTVLTCRAAGVSNVAWASPLFEGPFAFTTGAGHSWSELYADCLANCSTSSPTWATGSNRVYDVDGIDIYVSRSIDSRPFATQMAVATGAMTAAGLTPLPWVIGELGVHAGYPDDPNYRTREMTAAWQAMRGNPAYPVAAWWNTGGESFCHGATPASDPGCAAEQILAGIVGDPLTVHP